MEKLTLTTDLDTTAGIVSREPTQSSNIEWCRFEDRSGPASRGDDRSFTVSCAE
jgi:hypothetical protein